MTIGGGCRPTAPISSARDFEALYRVVNDVTDHVSMLYYRVNVQGSSSVNRLRRRATTENWRAVKKNGADRNGSSTPHHSVSTLKVRGISTTQHAKDLGRYFWPLKFLSHLLLYNF